jgi:chemotaxis protein methyltransferase CheR
MRVMPAIAEIERFRSLVAQRLGLHFEDAKLDFLAEVLQRRMENSGCNLFSLYEKRIADSGSVDDEVSALAEDLTVNETYFLRYAEQFRAFAEQVVPDRILARGQERKLRILSAGCASGEEPYSLAILMRERLPELAAWEVEIRGIDVSASSIEKSKRARYSTWSLRETSADLRAKYFRSAGSDVVLDSEVRRAVTFERRNLVDEDPGFWQDNAFDVVFCRNVTMYFKIETARSVISRIARSLAPGGFLFLGHAETLRGVSQEFHLRHTHETFYYQRREIDEMNSADACAETLTREGSFRGRIPAVAEPGESWFNVIRRASERVTSLTQAKKSLAIGASSNSSTGSPQSPGAVGAPQWDRTLAIELLRKERFAEALELLRALPAVSAVDPDSQLLLGVLLTNSGDLLEAEKVCRNVLGMDELNAGAHYLMALCREHSGDREAAMQHDRAATYLDAAFAMPRLHLGLAAKRCGDMDTARRELGQALPLLDREDPSRVLLFGGGFTREALVEFCRAELISCGGRS